MGPKYYALGMLGGFFFMVAIGIGFMAGAQYGSTIGWLAFILSAASGVMLHRLATLFEKNMIRDRSTRNWHNRIIADAEKTLGRKLTDTERCQITSRGGYLALEMIHDTIRAGTKEEIVSYLNSEAGESSQRAARSP